MFQRTPTSLWSFTDGVSVGDVGPTFQIGKVPIMVVGAIIPGVVPVWRTTAGIGVVPVNTRTVYEIGVVLVKEEAGPGIGIVPIDGG